jgi:hypothetical protein
LKRIFIFLSFIISISANQLKVPSQYSTIQAAIDASNDGDTVSVSVGTYKERLEIIDKEITILGENPLKTIIDGFGVELDEGYGNGNGDQWIRIVGKKITISGFTIMNVPSGNILYHRQSSITNCIIKNNKTTGTANGEAMIRSDLIEDVAIIDNNIEHGILFLSKHARVNRVSIANNITGFFLISMEFLGGIIKNMILWGNTTPNGPSKMLFAFDDSQTLKDISYSIIQTDPLWLNNFGPGVIALDPLFCDYVSNVFPNLKGNYNLTPSSPAIGSGENGTNMGAFVDIGCDIDRLETLSEIIPKDFFLHENYPNPFNPTTTLRFDLPQVSDVTLTIYNMLGQKVRTYNMNDTPAGFHSIKWNATNDYGDPVGVGVYLYQLRANQFVKTRKMVLLK